MNNNKVVRTAAAMMRTENRGIAVVGIMLTLLTSVRIECLKFTEVADGSEFVLSQLRGSPLRCSTVGQEAWSSERAGDGDVHRDMIGMLAIAPACHL